MSKMAKGLVGKHVSSQGPENVLALAAMLIATAVTGCSTLMEPDHADAALMESNSGLSTIHHYQNSSATGKISQRQLAAGI